MKHQFKMINGCLCNGTLVGDIYVPSNVDYVEAECQHCGLTFGLEYQTAKCYIIPDIKLKPIFKGWKHVRKLSVQSITELVKIIRSWS